MDQSTVSGSFGDDRPDFSWLRPLIALAIAITVAWHWGQSHNAIDAVMQNGQGSFVKTCAYFMGLRHDVVETGGLKSTWEEANAVPCPHRAWAVQPE